MRVNLTLASALLVSVTAAIASAVPIAPGAFINPLPSTTSAAEPQLAGGVVQNVTRTLTGNFTSNNLPYEVSVLDRVILANDGTYDFYFAVTLVDQPSSYPLRVRRDGFAGLPVSAGWRSDGLGDLGPQSATRTADGSGIQFDFGQVVAEGTVTKFFFLDTQAKQYALNSTAIIDLSPSFNVTAYPTFATFGPAIPEPVTSTILAAATISALPRRRSRLR